MNIASFSVGRPVATWMRILIFILLGAIAYTQLPIELLPSVNRPAIYVTTQWPGVAPEDLEVQITVPIEDAVATVPGMRSVDSQTSEGTSRVTVEFQPNQDMSQGALEVLQQVQRAQRNFPTDDPTLQAPTIRGFDPSAIPILVIGVTGIDDPVRLRTVLEEEIKPILESAEGVGSVEVEGGVTGSLSHIPGYRHRSSLRESKRSSRDYLCGKQAASGKELWMGGKRRRTPVYTRPHAQRIQRPTGDSGQNYR